MSGDRLAEINELRRSGQLGAITVSDVLALIEIAKAAREYVEHAYPCLLTGKSDPSLSRMSALGAALARLDSGATEENT